MSTIGEGGKNTTLKKHTIPRHPWASIHNFKQLFNNEIMHSKEGRLASSWVVSAFNKKEKLDVGAQEKSKQAGPLL